MVFSKSGYCTMCFSGERERLSHHSQQHLTLWQEVSCGSQLGPRLPGGTSPRLCSKGPRCWHPVQTSWPLPHEGF